MSDSIPTPVPAAPTPLPNCPVTDPVRAFAALGDAWRWKILLMLADGKVLTATDVARALGRNFDGVSKNLRLLREAGWIARKDGGDVRYVWYHIPVAFRPEPGVLDYGLYRLHVPS